MASARQLALRRPDQCRECKTELAIGDQAWWDPASRTVTCLSCLSHRIASTAPATIDVGRPGASAFREYERRRDAREARARQQLGASGAVLIKGRREPVTDRVWHQGGMGEVRAAQRLEELLADSGVRLLHDRRVPGHGLANIDHLAVGPGGLTVIDTKTHHGRIRRDWHGGLFSPRRTSLIINGRDQSKLINGVHKQMGYVLEALGRRGLDPGVDVAGALCFLDVNGLPWFRQIEIDAVLVEGPKRVARLAARPGLLSTSLIEHVLSELAQAFPPA